MYQTYDRRTSENQWRLHAHACKWTHTIKIYICGNGI